MSMSDKSPAAILDISTHPRIAGEVVHGYVNFDLARAQEEMAYQIQVELIGVISTFIDASPLVQEEVFLINSTATLWTEGDDLASSDNLKRIFPFQFDLPSHLPPSFKAASARQIGDISYSIQLISVQSNTFKKTRSGPKFFCVIPTTTPKNIYYKSILLDGWKHGLQSFKVENQIRRWPWEDYSRVQAELTIPDLPSFPTCTPIPFRLLVTTETRQLKRPSNLSSFARKKDSFYPVPPTSPLQIDLHLAHHATVTAKSQVRSIRGRVEYLGGMSDDSVLARLGNKFQTNVEEPEWVPHPTEKSRGTWKRTVRFESFMEFSCPPSFTQPTLTNEYTLHLKIPFPGKGNALKSDFPININSGVRCSGSPQLLAHSSSSGAGHVR